MFDFNEEVVLWVLLDKDNSQEDLQKIMLLKRDIEQLVYVIQGSLLPNFYANSKDDHDSLSSKLGILSMKISSCLQIKSSKLLKLFLDNAIHTLKELSKTLKSKLLLFSYEPGTTKLHQVNLLTGEAKVYSLAKVLRWYMCWVEVPSSSLMFTGGFEENVHCKDAFTVDLRRDFSVIEKTPMLNPRKKHHCVYLDGYVYAIGGFKTSSCERHCVAENVWENIPDLPHVTFRHTAVAMRDSIYVMGGYTVIAAEYKIDSCSSIQVFNVQDFEWSLLELSLPYPDSYMPCFKLPEFNESIFFLSEGSIFNFDTSSSTIKQVKAIDDNEVHSFFGSSYYVEGKLYVSDIEGPVNVVEVGNLDVIKTEFLD
mmetsp:Transcript_1672/g.3584  ORF Transcript_1672/g.3584 Transcript_1672/m.3584 type:complete len:367 (-) Transcript_1672:31-1131(-)